MFFNLLKENIVVIYIWIHFQYLIKNFSKLGFTNKDITIQLYQVIEHPKSLALLGIPRIVR